MISNYIQAALNHAKYDIIDDEEPYYGEIPPLQGVWASAKTLEKCREILIEVLEGWIILRIRNNQSIPSIDGVEITVPREISVSE